MFASILDRVFDLAVRRELRKFWGLRAMIGGDYMIVPDEQVRTIMVCLHGQSMENMFCFDHAGNSGSCGWRRYTVRYGTRRAWLKAAKAAVPGREEDFLRDHGVECERNLT